MRTCEEYEALVSAFIDGALTEAERETLMEHMASCPACQQYFDDQIAIHDALTDLEAEAPEDFTEKVMAKVRLTAQSRPEPEKPEKRIIAFPRWRQWAALAACCAVAALGVWGFSGQKAPEGAALSRSAAANGSVYSFASDEAAQMPEEQGEDCDALDDSAPPPGESTNQDTASSRQAAEEPEAALTMEPACADNTAAQEDVQRDSQYVTILTTASPAAADWVEKNLGEPWEENRGYDLAAEQFGELLALLEQEEADFTLQPAEKGPLWYELRVE